MNGIEDNQKTQSSVQNVKAHIGTVQEKTKKCTGKNGCGKVKFLSEFPKNKESKLGHRSPCIECNKKYMKTYARARNQKPEIKIRTKIYKRKRRKNQLVREETNKWDREYSKLPHVAENRRKRRRAKRRENEKFRINSLMSCAIWRALKKNDTDKNGYSWLVIVGYDHNDLIKHLKRSLKKLNIKSSTKYTWADFISGRLHIDHILPQSKFNYDSAEHPEFKRCWALNNLQLLPALENLKKSDKCESFQTAF